MDNRVRTLTGQLMDALKTFIGNFPAQSGAQAEDRRQIDDYHHGESQLYGAIPVETTKDPLDLSAADFENPSQNCDFVMRGGITSGVVYPSAILRIAQHFRLKSIGGTSAGAIAAAVAAAAEFRRSCRGDGGSGFI